MQISSFSDITDQDTQITCFFPPSPNITVSAYISSSFLLFPICLFLALALLSSSLLCTVSLFNSLTSRKTRHFFCFPGTQYFFSALSSVSSTCMQRLLYTSPAMHKDFTFTSTQKHWKSQQAESGLPLLSCSLLSRLLTQNVLITK